MTFSTYLRTSVLKAGLAKAPTATEGKEIRQEVKIHD